MKKKFVIISAFVLALSLFALAACSASFKSGDGYTDGGLDYTYYPPTAEVPDEGITLDGDPSEQLWKDSVPHVHTSGGATVSTRTLFGEKGLYFAVDVDVVGVYYSGKLSFARNSRIELVAYDPSVTAADYGYKSFHFVSDAYDTQSTRAFRYAAAQHVEGELNSTRATGISVEYYLPYEEMGYDEKPENVCVLASYLRTMGTGSMANGTLVRPASADADFAGGFLFDDRGFVGADKDGWVLGNSASGASRTASWDVSQGDDGIFKSTNGKDQWIYFRNASATDYMASVKMRMIGGVNDNYPRFGIMLGSSEAGYAAFLLDGREAYLDSGKIEGRLLIKSSTWQLGPVIYSDSLDTNLRNVDITLKTIKHGDQYYLFFNDKFVGRQGIDFLPVESVPGAYTVGGSAQFSDCTFESFDGRTDALLEEIGKYVNVIEVTPFDHGSISVDKSFVFDGGSVTLDFGCDEGYEISKLTVNGDDVTAKAKAEAANGKWTLTDIDTHINITAETSPCEMALVEGNLVSATGEDLPMSGQENWLAAKQGLGKYPLPAIRGEFAYGVPVGEYVLHIDIPGYWPQDIDVTVTEEGVDIGTVEFESSMPIRVNAQILVGDKLAVGNATFDYGDMCVISPETSDNKWSFIEGSLGSAQMITVTISVYERGSDSDPSAGITFSPVSDAARGGYNVLWWRKGIRMARNTPWTTHDSPDLGLQDIRVDGTSATITVVRKNENYYAFANDVLVWQNSFAEVGGLAAMGFWTSGCRAKFADYEISADETVVDAYLDSHVFENENPVNATLTNSAGEKMTGNATFAYIEDGVKAIGAGTNKENYFSYIEDSLGEQSMVTATVEVLDMSGNNDPAVGFIFSPKSDALKNGYAIAWYRYGIRAAKFGPWQANDYPNGVLPDIRKAGSKATFTVIRKGTTYYAIADGVLMHKAEYTAFSGEAAIALFYSGGCLPQFTNYSFTTDAAEIDAALEGFEDTNELFNATVMNGDTAITGKSKVMFGDNGRNALMGVQTGDGYMYSYLADSFGSVQMVSATIEMYKAGDKGNECNAGFTFSSVSDCNASGWNILWYKAGIRAVRNGTWSTHIDKTDLGFARYPEGTAQKFTVVRREHDYFVFYNDKFAYYVSYDGVSGGAAIGLWSQSAVAKFSNVSVNVNEAEVNEFLAEHPATGFPVNVTLAVGGNTLEGNTTFAYTDDGAVQSTAAVTDNTNRYTYLANSVGDVHMITATIEIVELNTGADPYVGFAFSPEKDALAKGYVVSWRSDGIRMATVSPWKQSDLGSTFLPSAKTAGNKVTLTAIRKNNTYYALSDGILLHKTTNDRCPGSAAIALFVSGGCKAKFGNVTYTTDAAAVDAALEGFDTPSVGVNATVTNGSAQIKGSDFFIGDNGTSAVGGVTSGNGYKYTYLADSLGTTQMITATIEQYKAGNQANEANAGFTFSTASECASSGYNILWYKKGIRAARNTPWKANDKTDLGFGHYNSDATETLTVVRREHDYFVFRNNEFVYNIGYDGVTGNAAIGLWSQGAMAKFSDITVTADEAEVNEFLAGFPNTGYFVNASLTVGGETVTGNTTFVYEKDGNGVTSAATTKGERWTYLADSVCTDAVVTLTITYFEGADTDPCAGVTFSPKSDANVNGYNVTWFRSGIKMVRNKDWNQAKTNVSLGLPKINEASGSSVTLTVVKKGDTYYAFHDGSKIFENTYENTIGECAIGLWAQGAKFTFSGITIEKDPEKVGQFLTEHGVTAA